MAIEFNCSQCGKLLRTTDDKAGLEAKCPDCGASIAVPAASLSDEPFASSSEPSDVSSGAPVPGEPMKACPMCGEQIRAAAIKCRYCGEDLRTQGATGHMQPHRGVLILVFGILSIVIWCTAIILSPIAWVMANKDLAEMKAGRMDPGGEGITRAGKICAIIGLCFFSTILLFYCVIGIVAGLGNMGNF